MDNPRVDPCLESTDRSRSRVPLRYEQLPITPGVLFLYCQGCGGRFSAARGDYFGFPADVATCMACGGPLVLAREIKMVQEVSPPVECLHPTIESGKKDGVPYRRCLTCKRNAPYPWCVGNPTVADCIRHGACRRPVSCGD